MRKQKVLFLRTQNSARSPIAEGLSRHLAGDRFEVMSAGLEATESDVSFKTILGRDSGETFQILFEGPGWVLIQPSEGPTVPPHTHAQQGGFR